MYSVYVKDIGYVYCTKLVGWSERLPVGAKWLGVAQHKGKVLDCYSHAAGNFLLKG